MWPCHRPRSSSHAMETLTSSDPDICDRASARTSDACVQSWCLWSFGRTFHSSLPCAIASLARLENMPHLPNSHTSHRAVQGAMKDIAGTLQLLEAHFRQQDPVLQRDAAPYGDRADKHCSAKSGRRQTAHLGSKSLTVLILWMSCSRSKGHAHEPSGKYHRLLRHTRSGSR